MVEASEDVEVAAAPPKARSPLGVSLGRFWEKRGARWSCYAVLGFMLLGVYAPFLASDAALVWWDERGLRFPVLGDLFNVWSYPQRHDLLFNILALLLPVFAITWWALRKRWGVQLRLGVFALISAVAWIACQLPLFAPLSEGADRRAAWDRREQTDGSYATLRHLRAMEQPGLVTPSRDDVVIAPDGTAVTVVMVDREAGVVGLKRGDRLPIAELRAAPIAGDMLIAEDGAEVRVQFVKASEGVAVVRAAGGGVGGERRELPLSSLRTPERTLVLVPLVPHDYGEPYAGSGLLRPGEANPVSGATFWLGTDLIGRDVLSLMLFGARISMTVGLLSTGIAMLIGVVVGAVSGYFGGWVDLVLQRIVEIMMTFPTFILILIVVSVFGRNIFVIISVIGLVGWAGTARLTRGEFLSQMGREYVLACQALGLPRWRIMFRHILPNAMTPLLISASFGIAGAVLSESGLAFLGLVESTTPSWGLILNSGRDKIEYPHLLYAPGIAIFILVYTLNIIGNGLREAFDPKGAGR